MTEQESHVLGLAKAFWEAEERFQAYISTGPEVNVKEYMRIGGFARHAQRALFEALEALYPVGKEVRW